MIAFDYVGVGVLITASCAGVASVITAFTTRGTRAEVAKVHDAVHMSNGETIGAVVEANDLRYLDPKNPPTPPTK